MPKVACDDFGVLPETLRNLAKQAEVDAGEREEVRWLRSEVKVLREERVTLKAPGSLCYAVFAQEANHLPVIYSFVEAEKANHNQ